MTPAQYATHRGCSDSYVRRLRRKGQLVVQGKLIDAAASDLVLDAMLDPVRGGDRTSPLGDGVAAAPKTTAVLTVPAGPSVHEAVRRERLAKARLAELELGEQAGELTRKRDIDRAVFTLVRQALERMRSIGSRLRQQLAQESDPRACEALIDAEVQKVCTEMRLAAAKLRQPDIAHGGEASDEPST
jgi:hypothetical protein